MSRTHLLVVGDPGDEIRLLREQRQNLEISVLCRSTLIPVQATLTYADRILATGPADETAEAWIATAVAVHTVAPVGLVAAFGPRAYHRAAMIADTLGTGLYPRAGFGGIADRWRTRQRLLAAGYDAGAASCVRDSKALEKFIAEHGMPCYVRSRRPGAPGAVLNSYRDVDPLIYTAGKLGPCMVAEPVPDGDPYLVALRVDSEVAEPLAVLPRDGSPPAAARSARGQLTEHALGIAGILGVRDGVLIVDLAVSDDRVTFGGVTLGAPSADVRAEILRAAGTDTTQVCAAQVRRLLAGEPARCSAGPGPAAGAVEGGPNGDHDVR